MNRFNRDYALLDDTGRILLETNSLHHAAQLRDELWDEGIRTKIVESDLPNRIDPR